MKCLLLGLIALLHLVLLAGAAPSSTDYDLLIFAQSWPVTTCIEWKERGRGKTCNIPTGEWTVHGIWPTKLGRRGPNDCDENIKFDSRKIQDIKSDLEEHWTDVHKGSRPYGFWKHEYEKHGSCATDLPQLDTQEEYFKQGIEWNKKYDLADMLEEADITPGGNYTWLEIYTAVKQGLGGRKPAVQCEHDKELNLKTLAQIYICFDKSLQLTDCTGISGGINIGCPRKDRFYFPGPARFGGSTTPGNRQRQKSNLKKDVSYDFFLFAQTWPTTTCIEWKERSEQNTCNVPPKVWTVHGLWPTRAGEIGPGFCDPNDHFNPKEIKPILKDLEDHWTNVHKNSDEYSFWEHEWDKHGTCAKTNPRLSSEYNYFHMGLELNEKYPLADYLTQANIKPGGTYSYHDIFNAVKSRIGDKNPGVQCEYDHETKLHTLAQIDICLTKDLEVMDCNQIHGGLNHNCPTHGKQVFYPDLKRVASSGKLWIVFTVIVIAALLGTIGYAMYKKWWIREYTRSSGYSSI